MSFILDALRKSENERRLESAPDVVRVPLAIPKNRLPGWAIAVIAILAAALVGVGMFWWADLRMELGPSLPTPALTLPEPSSGLIRNDAIPVPTVVPALESGRTDPVTSDEVLKPDTMAQDAVPVGAAEALSQPENRAEPATSTSTAAFDLLELPSATQLAAEGVMVPALSLQLLVNSPDSSRRFVLINGRRYGEGQRMTEGPEVVAIAPDGAVLRYQDRQFLLVPD